MLCSIIIINYNYAHFLNDAIKSALNQSYRNCEVIVVDDGSTDDSQTVIRKFGKNVTPVYKKNGGALSATNSGFKHSRGDLIFFLDADDFYDVNTVEEVVSAYKKGVSYLCWRLRQVNSTGEELGLFPLEREGPDSGCDAWRGILNRGAVNYPPTSSNAYCRVALEQIFPLPESTSVLWADVHMFSTMPFLGEVIAMDKVLSNYRVHGNNHWFKEDLSGKQKKIFGLNRKSPKQFQEGILKAKQKFDLLEAGRKAKKAEWGTQALERWLRLRWKQLYSIKCLPETHPFAEDTMRSLSKEIIGLSCQLGVLTFRLRFRLFLVCALPGKVMSIILLKN